MIFKGETSDGARKSGMATPMTDGAGNMRLEEEAGPASQDAGDSFGTDGANAGIGIGIGIDVGVGVGPVDVISPTSGSANGATTSRCVVPPRG